MDIDWVTDIQIEAPEAPLPHHCFAAQHLAEMERIVRQVQQDAQAYAAKMAVHRRGIMQCLYRHHHMSYQAIADLLGGLTASRVREIEQG